MGHCEYWLLKAHPELAEDPRRPYNYDPSNPRVYSILFDLFEEVIEVFQPRYFHIGHDEVRGTLGSSPSARGRLPYEWFAADVAKLHGYLKERGIRTMMWGDMLLAREDFPGLDATHSGGFGGGSKRIARAIEALPKDIIICDWHYKVCREYPSLAHFRRRGSDVIATPWCARRSNFYFAQAALDAGALGVIGSRWGGNRVVADQPISHHSSGLLLTAECAWSPGVPSLEELPKYGEIALRMASDLHGLRGQRRGLLFGLPQVAKARLDAGQDWLCYPGTADLTTALPVGDQCLGAVLFRISEEDGAPRGIALRGPASPTLPTIVRIRVGKKLRSIFFLHTCGWFVPQGGIKVGRHEIVFADGKREEIPLVMGENIAEITADPKLLVDAPLAWTTKTAAGRTVTLPATAWHNHTPRKEVSQIVFSSTGRATPILLALTAIPARRQ